MLFGSCQDGGAAASLASAQRAELSYPVYYFEINDHNPAPPPPGRKENMAHQSVNSGAWDIRVIRVSFVHSLSNLESKIGKRITTRFAIFRFQIKSWKTNNRLFFMFWVKMRKWDYNARISVIQFWFLFFLICCDPEIVEEEAALGSVYLLFNPFPIQKSK